MHTLLLVNDVAKAATPKTATEMK